MSGFFAIGVSHTKTAVNIGTLWRSANIMGAAFLFTVGRRYKRQPSDTLKSWRSIPLYNYLTFADLKANLPFDCKLVGVELDDRAVLAEHYQHPKRCVYLLGAEDHGLTREELDGCHDLIKLPGERSLNVAVAGSLVMYDRQLSRRQS